MWIDPTLVPIIRRCPKCGDDLSTEEEVCVFCGHRLGRAGILERIRLNLDDWLRIGASAVVAYFVGLDMILWLIGIAAPGVQQAVYASPAIERGLRWTITTALLGGLVWLAIPARRPPSPPAGGA